MGQTRQDPRHSIRIVIWILLSDTDTDTGIVNSIKISSNTETAMPSEGGVPLKASNTQWSFQIKHWFNSIFDIEAKKKNTSIELVLANVITCMAAGHWLPLGDSMVKIFSFSGFVSGWIWSKIFFSLLHLLWNDKMTWEIVIFFYNFRSSWAVNYENEAGKRLLMNRTRIISAKGKGYI